MRQLFTLAMILLLASPLQAQRDAPPAPTAPGSESLGGQLLDDLPGKMPGAPSNRSTPKLSQPLNEPAAADRNSIPPDPEIRFHPLRFDDVGARDAGPPSGPMRLVRAGQGMVQAESLLRKESTVAQARETQQQVVTQLDELIAELSKQCSGNCNNPSNKPPSPSQRSQTMPGKSGSQAGRGNSPARDSNDSLSGTTAKPNEKLDTDFAEFVKRFWGHLPEREREQMLQSFSDEFLPKYELEIEQYYRRLSEEAANRPRETQ
jgi:hypothetical protein